MPLPKIDQPIFTVELPSTQKPISFRPFTVKEEKVMLIAQESKDRDQIVNAVKQIINNCLTDDVNIDKLPTFDIEFLLVQLRAKSVDNIVEFKLKDEDTEEQVEVEMDLNEIQVIRDEDHKPLIQLTDDIHMQMRYPTFNELALLLTSEESSQDAMYDIMVSCIDMIIQGEDVHKLRDYTKEEVDDFIGSLNKKHLAAIKQFFDTMPKLRHEINYKNSAGDDKTFVIQGMDAFFI